MKYEENVEDLLRRIDSLEQLYGLALEEGRDIKLLQGLERCIELRMRLFGYDGKSPVVSISGSGDGVGSGLDLKLLSDGALREIRAQLER